MGQVVDASVGHCFYQCVMAGDSILLTVVEKT
jgi:hypothetical protein